MVDESNVMNVDESLKQQEWSPEEFAAVLYKFTEMTKGIRDMKATKRIAMFQVDAKGFAKSSLPFPQVSGRLCSVKLKSNLLCTRSDGEPLAIPCPI